jgi:hypothetical protein
MNKTLMERQQRFAKLIDAVDCNAFGVEFIAILGLDGDRFWLQLAYLIASRTEVFRPEPEGS